MDAKWYEMKRSGKGRERVKLSGENAAKGFSMLRGNYLATVDEKGRVKIPSDFLGELRKSGIEVLRDK